jgi:hypothetical protein
MVSLTKSSQIASHAGAHIRDPGHGGGVARPKGGMRCASEPVCSANGPRRTGIATTLCGLAGQPPEAAGSNNRSPALRGAPGAGPLRQLNSVPRAQLRDNTARPPAGCARPQRRRAPCAPLLLPGPPARIERFGVRGALRSAEEGNGHARIRRVAWEHFGLHRAIQRDLVLGASLSLG